jgi:tRNA(Ile)-lysidine synthetase-like protein
MGCNRLSDGSLLWVLDESTTPPPANVYTLSTQKVLSFATIEGELYVRSRSEGDAYRYGGITHKLKKVLNDKKIPRAMRSRLPVLCDDRGILWVPHLEGRDDGTRAHRPLTVLYLAGDQCPDAPTDAEDSVE